MTAKLVTAEYQGLANHFTEDGWFNATEAAESRGRRVDHWLETQETKDYIKALAETSNTCESGYLKTKRGRYSAITTRRKRNERR